MRHRDNAFLWFVGLGLAALVLLSIAAIQVPSEDRAVSAVENLGLHPTNVARGYSWGVLGGCHADDITKFTVRTREGRTIYVCAPLVGGYTIRN